MDDATRMSKLRMRLGLTQEELGEVFCVSGSHIYKMEAGIRPVTGLRLLVLDVLEDALALRTGEAVWGPRVRLRSSRPTASRSGGKVRARQRLARIFAAAHPEAIL